MIALGIGLITIGLVALVEHLTEPSEDRPELDKAWFVEHESVLWHAMSRVAADADAGRYASGKS